MEYSLTDMARDSTMAVIRSCMGTFTFFEVVCMFRDLMLFGIHQWTPLDREMVELWDCPRR